jgi:hypothetical protein
MNNRDMSTVDEHSPESAASVPDYLANPDAVLGGEARWWYGRAPDYSKTRVVFEQSP